MGVTTSSIFGIAVCICYLVYTPVHGQSNNDLYIYGFSQGIFNHKSISGEAFPVGRSSGLTVPSFSEGFESNSFSLHQTNLFLTKPINERTSFFLNAELLGSYSSSEQSGDLRLSEGWVSYTFSEQLKIKTGLLLPVFNNLNEINNRLPLFPYIIRPLVYERLWSNLYVQEDYLPQTGYVQLSGITSVSPTFDLEYAVQVGNSEQSYASDVNPRDAGAEGNEATALYRGENLTTLLAYSGRIGLTNKQKTIKLGVSGSFDHDNKNESVNESITRFPRDAEGNSVGLPVYGDVRRFRIGGDFSFHTEHVDFEAEFIRVLHDHSDIRSTPQLQSANLNKFFAYGLVAYNVSEKLFGFGGVNYLQDESYEIILPDSPDAAGAYLITAGGGWHFTDELVLKVQWSESRFRDNEYVTLNSRFVTIGLGVIF
ncbi:MAG: hypothetical protein AAFW89_01290 [Bacteroidota bacterium]